MADNTKEMSPGEKIADLKGSVLAIEAMLCALIESFSAGPRDALLDRFEHECEGAKTVLLNSPISDRVIHAIDRDRDRILDRYRHR